MMMLYTVIFMDKSPLQCTEIPCFTATLAESPRIERVA